jgi:hypothetical protein
LANFMTTMRRPIVVITLRVMNPGRHHAERDDYFLLSQPPSEGGQFHEGNAPAGAVAAASSRSIRSATLLASRVPSEQLRIGQIPASACGGLARRGELRRKVATYPKHRQPAEVLMIGAQPFARATQSPGGVNPYLAPATWRG